MGTSSPHSVNFQPRTRPSLGDTALVTAPAGHGKTRLADELRAELKAVNERLWVIEDDIRLKEKAQAFDDEMRALRAVLRS